MRFSLIASIFFIISAHSLVGQTDVTVQEIQGNSLFSPIINQQINLNDVVVTAAYENLIFVQSPTADNNLQSSDGVMVIWDDAEDFLANDQVSITGRVVEFESNTTIEAFSITKTGQASTANFARPLDNFFPGETRESINKLEYVEGQLVSFDKLLITGPSQGGDFAYVSPSNNRPLREAGIEYPGTTNLPEWDGNPEVFYFISDGLGLAPNAFLHADMKITGTGIIVQGSFNYALLPISYVIVEETDISIPPSPAADEFNLGNLNTLFLDAEDGSYDLRLDKISQYIINQLGTPDVVALQEITGGQEFTDLAERLSEATGLEYSSYTVGTNRFLNNGFLVRNTFSVSNIEELGNNQTFEGDGLHSRPPLLLEGFINSEDGQVPLSILNLHIRSLSGIEGNSQDFVRRKRHAEALSIAQMVANLQADEKQFFVVGDFNAFQFSDGYVDVVNQIAGTPSIGAQFEVQNFGIDPPLQNISVSLSEPEERYSFVFRGIAQILDHCLASVFQVGEISHFHYGRGNADYPDSYLNQDSPFRASDHDGFAVYLDVDASIIEVSGVVATNTEIAVPNPFTFDSEIIFQLEEKQNIQCELFNLAGQLMYSSSLGAIENDRIALSDLQNFTSGLYILKVTGRSLDSVHKILLIK